MSTLNTRKRCVFAAVLVAILIFTTACSSWDRQSQVAAGADPTSTTSEKPKPENLTPPTSAATPNYNAAELWQKCQSMFSMSDADKEAAGVTPANCLWAQQEVAKSGVAANQSSSSSTSTTAAPATATTPPPPPTTDTTAAPIATTSTLASTTTKPPGMSDVVALALMAQQMAEQNGLKLGVGVTCDFNCVLLNGIQGQTNDQKAWSLLMKAVQSPVFLDDAARTVQGDSYADARPVNDPAKAASDLEIVMGFVNGAKLESGVIPAGTLVYNTVVQDGRVVEFSYVTTKDREYVQFTKNERYIRFFTTCGNRTTEAPPGTPVTPNPPPHDDIPPGQPVPPGPTPPPTVVPPPGGKDASLSPLNNPRVPPGQKHTSDPPITVGPVPVPPVTTPTGCNGPCPTNAPPPTSNPATTLPQSCSYEPGTTTCVTAPPPPTAPPSTVGPPTTHTSMPPKPGS